jgi:hypothetical protein
MVFILIVLSAFLFDIISTYYTPLLPFCFKRNPYVLWFIQNLGRQIGLLTSFSIWATMYVGILFLFDSAKLYITEGAFSISLGFSHFLAGISNTSIYFNVLWIHITLRDFLLIAENEGLLLIPTALILFAEAIIKLVI